MSLMACTGFSYNFGQVWVRTWEDPWAPTSAVSRYLLNVLHKQFPHLTCLNVLGKRKAKFDLSPGNSACLHVTLAKHTSHLGAERREDHITEALETGSVYLYPGSNIHTLGLRFIIVSSCVHDDISSRANRMLYDNIAREGTMSTALRWRSSAE